MSKLLENLPAPRQLTAESEADCMARGDSGRSDLVLATLAEAFLYARKCCHGGVPEDEVLSLCYDALQKSVSNYDPSRGRFFAYSKVYVRGELSQFWKGRDIVKHSSQHEDKNIPAREGFHQPNSFASNYADLSEKFESGSDEWERQFGTAEMDFEAIRLNELWEIVSPIIESKLSGHARMIIKLRHTSGFGFQHIADLLGISKCTVHDTHRRALMKIRAELYRKKKLYDI